MKLSNQALGTIMMALQKSLLEQTDIVPILKELTFKAEGDTLTVNNPPSFKIDNDTFKPEVKTTVGSD